MSVRTILFVVAQFLSLNTLAWTQDDIACEIAELRQRAIQATDIREPESRYIQAKVDSWLDFAFEEHVERDSIAEEALQRARQLIAIMETRREGESGTDGKDIVHLTIPAISYVNTDGTVTSSIKPPHIGSHPCVAQVQKIVAANRLGTSVASNHESACASRFPHPILPPVGNPHPIPLPKGEGSFALSPYGGKMDRGLGENEALRDFHCNVGMEKLDNELLPSSIRLRSDLWNTLGNIKGNLAGFPCSAPFIGKAEVMLVWSGHEQPELGDRHVRRYLLDAENYLKQADKAAQNCVQTTTAPPVVLVPVVEPVAPPPPSPLPEAEAASPPGEPGTLLAQLPDAIHFAFDSSTLSPESDQVLQLVAKTLYDYPLLKLELGGHTDRRGDQQYNLKLSKRRVENVYQRLIALGVSPERFTTSAHGKSRLLTNKDDRKSRSLDRRVELIITNQGEDANVKIQSEEQKGDLQQ